MPTSKNSYQAGVVFSKKKDQALLEEIALRVVQLHGLQTTGGFILDICRWWYAAGAPPVTPPDKAMQIQAGKWTEPKKK